MCNIIVSCSHNGRGTFMRDPKEIEEMTITLPYYPDFAIDNYKVAYHYTSPDAFRTIIEKKQLRFSRIDCMNDYMDGKIMEDLYPKALQEMLKDKTISQNYFEQIKNIEPRAYRIVNEVTIPDKPNSPKQRYIRRTSSRT